MCTATLNHGMIKGKPGQDWRRDPIHSHESFSVAHETKKSLTSPDIKLPKSSPQLPHCAAHRCTSSVPSWRVKYLLRESMKYHYFEIGFLFLFLVTFLCTVYSICMHVPCQIYIIKVIEHFMALKCKKIKLMIIISTVPIH